MRLTADTNVLVRAIAEDNPTRSKAAQTVLQQADCVAVPLMALCELAWVLSRGYKVPPGSIAEAIRRLIDSANVVVNRPAVEAGLAHLDRGGDFADGVIAYEGRWLGGETFVSFDRQAVNLVVGNGGAACLLPA